MSEKDRKLRAEARHARMKIARGHDNDLVPIFGANAVSLAAQMSKQQWLLAEKALPTYTRSEIPIVYLAARTE